MRFQLISDDTDTLVGMRLAGISGVVAHTREEVEKALLDATKMEDVAIVLITESLTGLCENLIRDLKMTCRKPLIVEIPDSESTGVKKNSITKYVADAIGIKI